ncbi:MAG: matrixin family metalloprotease [Verrucomicrobia bacterium]|nr:matrixin family metalloprotease [Verrucomicrobiota bacterium]
MPRSSHAYALEGVHWPAGSVVNFQMGLGSAGRTLIDGNTSWDAAATPGPSAWDNVVANLKFNAVPGANVPVASGDGVNSVAFSSTVFGQAFGSMTLAVTYYISSGSNIIEADILFNNHQSFDSYRGPLRYGANGYAIGDIRRVFIHELGHALGLAHPDQNGQHVDAIMNSVTSDRETLSSDDTAGAQSLYGSAPAPAPTPTPTPAATPSAARFTNISTRLRVGTGNNVMIGGFTISGSQPKTVLVRALGPTLGSYGVNGVLADPAVELHDSTGAVIASNDDWQSGGQAAQISASGYAPANAKEAALIATLAPGAYTAVVHGFGNTTGVALIEVYQLDSSTSKLSNVSTRGSVGTGDNVLIGGIIVSGTTAKNVIVRAIGPTLAAPPFSMTGTLANPTIELHNASGALLFSNAGWTSSTQAGAIAASGYAPQNAAEVAIMATLSAGSYTAIVRGANETSGIALMDAYDLGP